MSDLLREERYTSIGELVEAAKRRCIRLRMPYEQGQLTDAIEGMHDQVTREIAVVARSRHVERKPDAPPLTVAELAAKCPELAARVLAIVRSMPTVKRITPRDIVQRAALVDEAIAESVARLTALEANPPDEEAK